MSELAIIERITARNPVRDGTILGIGDDAAVLDLGGRAVVTHDMLVDGVHFRRATTGLRDLGWKALAVNLSDLAAMGAEPVAALVGLGLPTGALTDGDIDDLYAGMDDLAGAVGVTVAGGDVTSSPVLVLGVTALGRAAPDVEPVRRSGARPGDALCVTGALGAAAAGLRLLDDPQLLPGLAARDALVAAHRRPLPRLEAGRRLAHAGATAMMDLSDGLVLDAGRMAAASGLRAVIDLAGLPVAGGVPDVAAALGLDVADLAAAGGEDYELLAALPPAAVDACRAALDVPLTVVGRLEAGAGVAIREADGAPWEPGPGGWLHAV
ncbi:MAG TPA: thiamine-phosphate kinase [Miltoncostaeaceae bacterium]|nr:thiamine-phosphate kinase [Miltoncostaeaceae bacterium]